MAEPGVYWRASPSFWTRTVATAALRLRVGVWRVE